MHRLFSGCVAALLASAPICLSAQAPTSIEELLALPPSPGVEVLLLPHAADPRVPLRWRQGVTDPDPSRRAAAARMLGIAGVRTAVGTLSAAWAKEEDVVARGEMLRALVVVGSDVTDRNVLRRVDQLSGLKADQVVRTLATVRPASVTAFLLGGGDLSDVRARASARGAAVHGRLLKVAPAEAARLEAQPDLLAPGVLQGILHMTHSTARRIEPPLVMAGLSRDAGTAGEILAYLPAVHSRPLSADTPLSKAYAAWRSAHPSVPDANHELLLALADRWLRRTPAAALPTAGVDPGMIAASQLPPVAFAVLSKEERRALIKQFAIRGDDAKGIEDASFLVRDRQFDWEGDTPTPILLADLPGAVLADLVRLTACEGKAYETDRALTTKYRPDGRPLSIVLGGVDLEPGCERLVQAIASASYGVATAEGDDAGRALLRVLPAFVACQVARDEDARRPSSAGLSSSALAAPRKVKDQKPAYPVALRTKVQGVVIVDAMVTSTGCVAEAGVVRSIPPLDLSALQAVASWEYEPGPPDARQSRWVSEMVNFLWER